MQARIILLTVGIIGAVAFLVGKAIEHEWLAFLSKPVPVLCMLVYVVVAAPRNRSSWAIVVGLGLSALGDVLLQRPIDFFMGGLVAFLLGHVAYIVGFTLVDRRGSPLRAIVPIGYGVAVCAWLYPHLGDLVIPVAVYMVVICAMLWRAAALVRPGDTAARLAVIGAALFVLSDTVLAINKFATQLPGAGYVIILLYWAGQLGIALSAKR